MATIYRRRLPHLHCIGRPIFITWRLHGTLPAGRSFPSHIASGKALVALDRQLDDACTGPTFLRTPELAAIVVEALHHRDERACKLHSYVVMPNHVHLLITPVTDVSRIMQSLKRYTGKQCNQILGPTNQPFWQQESYDRLVRNETEFHRITNYIELNPVKARLSAVPNAFPWSSAC